MITQFSTQITWYKYPDVKPPKQETEEPYLISGHEFFGICMYYPVKGWTTGWAGDFPMGWYGEISTDDGSDIKNRILWWAVIPSHCQYPEYSINALNYIVANETHPL